MSESESSAISVMSVMRDGLVTKLLHASERALRGQQWHACV